MKRNELISYAMSFASFLVRDNAISENITKIILFGSVARGDFDEESDVDIFVETKLQDRLIQKQLDLFNKSQIKEIYNLRGIKNDIALKVGNLGKWGGLKESIVEDGITLYGKYEESPKRLKRSTLFKVSVEKRKFSAKVKVWRKLYGYRQKIGKKIYASKGMVQKLDCVKLSKGIFIVPFYNRQKIIEFLDKNKVRYEMHDIYKNGQ